MGAVGRRQHRPKGSGAPLVQTWEAERIQQQPGRGGGGSSGEGQEQQRVQQKGMS